MRMDKYGLEAVIQMYIILSFIFTQGLTVFYTIFYELILIQTIFYSNLPHRILLGTGPLMAGHLEIVSTPVYKEPMEVNQSINPVIRSVYSIALSCMVLISNLLQQLYQNYIAQWFLPETVCGDIAITKQCHLPWNIYMLSVYIVMQH